jgi:hypothetical protein
LVLSLQSFLARIVAVADFRDVMAMLAHLWLGRLRMVRVLPEAMNVLVPWRKFSELMRQLLSVV